MKALLIIFTVFCSSVLLAQKASDVAKFDKFVYDFGNIIQNKAVTYSFKFKNIGKSPITVETATASCGCTTPTWPQSPVMAGKTNAINAGFNATTAGVFDKTITVKLAGIETPVELKIKGNVLTADEFAKLNKGKTKPKGKV